MRRGRNGGVSTPGYIGSEVPTPLVEDHLPRASGAYRYGGLHQSP